MVFGVGVDAAKKLRRSLHFVAADADADHVPIPIARREFENLLRLFHAEVAGSIENPEQRHAEIARPARPSALQSFEDRGEILLAEQADADRNVDFGMQHGFFFQLLHQPVGDELVVVRPAQVRAHFFECHQETWKSV